MSLSLSLSHTIFLCGWCASSTGSGVHRPAQGPTGKPRLPHPLSLTLALALPLISTDLFLLDLYLLLYYCSTLLCPNSSVDLHTRPPPPLPSPALCMYACMYVCVWRSCEGHSPVTKSMCLCYCPPTASRGQYSLRSVLFNSAASDYFEKQATLKATFAAVSFYPQCRTLACNQG